jgi:hypothetical protein
MAMTFDRRSDDGYLAVTVTGEWTAAAWRAAQVALAEKLRHSPDVRSLLVHAEGFLGWTGDGWDDLPTHSMLDAQIERLAIVGDKKWEDMVLMFAGKGVRRIQIEYFPTGQLERALRWLTSGAA